jgi:predicted metalloprotease with PDZ domain
MRRSVDFYDEGMLLWLEVDARIRRQTAGRRSLDDFCRAFFGGTSGPPEVKAYTEDDIVTALDAIAPSDWRAFFAERVTRVAEHPPTGGVVGSGWKLSWNDEPNVILEALETEGKDTSYEFSLGFKVEEEGEIPDVTPGLPAAEAGMAPGMKLVGVNGRKWSDDVLDDAVKASKDAKEPLVILAESGEFLRTFTLDYHGGLRYPHLARVEGERDTLSKVTAPRAAPRPKAKSSTGGADVKARPAKHPPR